MYVTLEHIKLDLASQTRVAASFAHLDHIKQGLESHHRPIVLYVILVLIRPGLASLCLCPAC